MSEDEIQVSGPIAVTRYFTEEELALNQAQSESDEYHVAAETIRARRDALLLECDWTQLQDSVVDVGAWASYRQALRDISDQPGFPYSVSWPTPPNN